MHFCGQNKKQRREKRAEQILVRRNKTKKVACGV
jgi:hypothetical protein